MANKQPRGEEGEGGLRGGFGVKWARGEEIFIGPESSGRSVLRAYVQYF
jgi:hypothetical protein